MSVTDEFLSNNAAFPRADLLNEPDAKPTVGPVSFVDGLPKGSALLVVKRGPNTGSRFLLDQPVTSAGRHRGSDIFLDDVTVSRRHAEFRWESDEFQVVDVGSLYGTYVNREAVDSAVLVDGDEVQIGKFRLVFLTGAQDRRRHRVTGPAKTHLTATPASGCRGFGTTARDWIAGDPTARASPDTAGGQPQRLQRPVDRELAAVRDGQREAHLPFQRERDDVLHGGLGGHISTVLY